MISIASSQLVKQPMYFFLSHLSLADLCYTSTVTPKLIADLLAAKKIISYHGCMTQLFTMHFFGGIEVFILTGMAYDRYVAICKPLLYTLIMTRQKCVAMIAACCAGGFLRSFGQFLLAIFLPYCGPCVSFAEIGLHWHHQNWSPCHCQLGPHGPGDFCGLVDILHCDLVHCQVLLCRESPQNSLHLQFPQHCGGPLFCSFILHLHLTSNYFTRRQSVRSFLYYHCSHAQSSNLHTEKLGDKEWHKEILVPYRSKKGNELKDTSDFHRWTWLNIWIFYNEDFKMYNACLICFFLFHFVLAIYRFKYERKLTTPWIYPDSAVLFSSFLVFLFISPLPLWSFGCVINLDI